MFIIGRAIAGVGASMITPGISLVITDIVPKDRRPILTGIAAMIGGTAACVGPIIGGVFVTHVSWRWSFFINLPFGFAAGVLFFVLYKPIPRTVRDVSWWTVICRLDPIGCSLLMSTVLTLLLAFTFAAQGGWNNAAVIALLIFSGTHLAAFVVEQMFRPPEYALLPPVILKKKVIVLCAIFGFCIEAGSTLHSYFLPTYFQGAKNKSAEASGIATLPQLLAQTMAGLAVGVVINFSGRFKPPMILGSILFAVGSGLLLSLAVNTQSSQLIGFQILSGFGTGCCMFMAMGIAQQRLDRDEESIGLSMVYMVKTLGS
jgi:MFS family permease